MAYLKIVLIILISLIISSCSGTIFNLTKSGQHSPQEVTNLYLSAVQTGDEQVLASLVMPKYDAQSAILSKIQQYKNTELSDVQVQYTPTESSYYVTANLNASFIDETGKSITVTDQLHFQQDGDEWFLVMGTPPNYPPHAPSPASTSQ